MIRGWLESELPTYWAWDRRQQRIHALLVAAPLGLFLAVGLLAPWSPVHLIELGPPLTVALLLVLRAGLK